MSRPKDFELDALDHKNLPDESDDDQLTRLIAGKAELVEPPEGLLDNILSEIPEDPSFTFAAPDAANDNVARYRRWAVAATLLMSVGVGSLMWRQAQPEEPTLFEHVTVAERSVEDAAAPTASEKTVQPRYPAPAPADGASADNFSDDAESRAAAGSRLRSRVERQTPAPKQEEALRSLGYLGETETAQRKSAEPSSGPAERRVRRVAPAKERPELKKDGSRSERPGLQAPAAPPAPRSDAVISESNVIPESQISMAVAVAESELPELPEADDMVLEIPSPPPVEYQERVVENVIVTGGLDRSTEVALDRAEEAPAQGSVSAAVTMSDAAVSPEAPSFFRAEALHPFVDTADDRLSTFGLDVDTGSYTIVRDYLRRDRLPPGDAVRIEEMLNYFDYGDPAPRKNGKDFAVTVDGAPSIYGPAENTYLMRVGIQGREIDAADRAPALLTFVVDVSGSMSGGNRLGLVQKSLDLLISQLRPTDRLALVVYGSRGRVLLEPTSDHGAIRRAVSQLRPEGSTNAGEGLELAYELTAEYKRPGQIHRVILCSDGVANVGDTTAEAILENVRGFARQGIELTTVGFGMGNYNDVLMERLANQGNGRYAYVDTLSEAHRIFVEDLTGTLQTLAAEARSQVEFDAERVKSYRLLGYENRDIADERFRDDTVDAGEIGAGHSVVALYEVRTHKPLKARHTVATVHLRYASVAAEKMVEQKVEVRGRDFAETWEAAPKALRLASLVAELAEILRGSSQARDGDPQDVLERLQKVAVDFSGDGRIAELTGLAAKVVELERRNAAERP